MKRCKERLFGGCASKGYGLDSVPYGILRGAGTDGCDRKHGYVQFKCDHCQEYYTVALVHEHPEDLRTEVVQIKALTAALKEMVLNAPEEPSQAFLLLAGVTEEDIADWKVQRIAPSA